MIVVKGIAHFLAFLHALHELCPAQHAQLMRDGGIGHFQRFGKFAHIHIAKLQTAQYFSARRVAEHLKEARKVIEGVVVGQLPPDRLRRKEFSLIHVPPPVCAKCSIVYLNVFSNVQ